MTRILCMAILALGGCSTFNTATSTVDMTALSKSAYTAKSTYAGLLVIAVAYNGRPRCTVPTTVITCSDPAIVTQMRLASSAADSATQAGENAVRSLGATPLVAQAAVVAAQNAVTAFKAITDIYH